MLDFFKDFFPIPWGLLVAAVLFCELAAWNGSRVTIALRGERGWRVLYAERLERFGMNLLWPVIWLPEILGNGQHELLVAIGLGFAAAGLLAAFWLSWWMSPVWGKNPEPLQISRGALFDGVGAVRMKAGMSCVLNVYVPLKGSQARSTDSENSASAGSIFIPRRLLDWMSRAEIDALVAFQLTARQRLRYARWTWFGILTSGVIASAALNWLKIGCRAGGRRSSYCWWWR